MSNNTPFRKILIANFAQSIWICRNRISTLLSALFFLSSAFKATFLQLLFNLWSLRNIVFIFALWAQSVFLLSFFQSGKHLFAFSTMDFLGPKLNFGFHHSLLTSKLIFFLLLYLRFLLSTDFRLQFFI